MYVWGQRWERKGVHESNLSESKEFGIFDHEQATQEWMYTLCAPTLQEINGQRNDSTSSRDNMRWLGKYVNKFPISILIKQFVLISPLSLSLLYLSNSHQWLCSYQELLVWSLLFHWSRSGWRRQWQRELLRSEERERWPPTTQRIEEICCSVLSPLSHTASSCSDHKTEEKQVPAVCTRVVTDRAPLWSNKVNS